MSKFIILTDSTTDLPNSIAQDFNLHVLPLKFFIEGKEYVNYLDNRELDSKTFYDMVKSGSKPTTSQINPEDYLEYLEPILKEGTDVLILSFSSALSGTFNSARIATDELKTKYPERKIHLLDTKSASLGEGLLVYLTAKKIKLDNLNIDEAHTYAKNLIPQIAHWFTVDDVGHLVRGGRVSKVAGLVAKIANIKPVMHTNDEGKLIPRAKVSGRKRAIKALFEQMEKTAKPGKQIVFIGHGNDIESANYLANLVKEKFEVEELVIHMIGPVIGAHTGQGVLALFFLADNR
ncbi:DegV family protein, partial [Acholeplasma granularum]|uniref:DegV family protein n=1 Tax=Acholeplasma granularum TaxID=264635 RepID=UPI0004B394AA